MSCRSFAIVFTPLVAGLALVSGCSSNQPAMTENKIHDTRSFTAEQLNAPLSPQARAKGAQVAPAPTR
jgi:predicted component of type VI protein secretion system